MQARNKRRIYKILMAAYLCVVAYVVFFRNPFRPWSEVFHGMTLFSAEHLHTVNLVPFRNIYKVFYEVSHKIIRLDTGIMNIAVNVALLLPFGILYPLITQRSAKHTVFAAFLLSSGIEITQFFTMTGFTDIDDVIMNTAGAAIGIIIFIKILKK